MEAKMGIFEVTKSELEALHIKVIAAMSRAGLSPTLAMALVMMRIGIVAMLSIRAVDSSVTKELILSILDAEVENQKERDGEKK